MAVPKRKTSTSKSRKRRTHYKAANPASSLCPECGEKMHPHRACPHCGYYKGRPFMKEEGGEEPEEETES